MKITVQLVVCDDDDHKESLTDVVILEKACQRIEEVGLTLAEAKALLSALQQQIVERQAATFLAMCRHCQACGTPLRTKGQHTITMRTLFGTITLTSPRLRHCPCTPHETATLSPLTALLPEHTAPELLFKGSGHFRVHAELGMNTKMPATLILHLRLPNPSQHGQAAVAAKRCTHVAATQPGGLSRPCRSCRRPPADRPPVLPRLG